VTHQPLSKVVVRTPVLPFDVLARWADAPDPRAVLRALVRDPAIREALYVASPELDAQIDAWSGAPEAYVGVERALVRYLTRMSARSTPFGLFSSVAVGEIGERSTLEVPARCSAHRHTRLDNDFLFALCTDLARDRGVRRHLRFAPSTSLYDAAGRLRYAEARLAGTVRAYHLVAVDRTPYLDGLLERAAANGSTGATFHDLVAVLTADPEISADEAAGFLDDVIDAQILVPTLAPNVTGREPTLEIIDALAGELAPLAAPLRDAYDALAAIDAAAPGVPASAYKAIEATLSALPGPGAAGAKIDPSRLFQVDLFKPATVTIGTPVIDELKSAVELLHRLAPPPGDAFARFRERFVARYETREVPLVEVLDEETGIGFSDGTPATNAPLLADLAFPVRMGPGRVSMGARDYHLMHLVAQALRSGATEIELSDDDVAALSQRAPAPLPDTIAVCAQVIGESAQAVAEGAFRLRLNFIGRGANLLGRFCHGSPEVAALTAEALRAEEAHQPDAVYAEIVHLPEGRHGNVLLRPVLRDYEIPFLGASGAAPDKQIGVADLVISIDTSSGAPRVVLRSKRLGCEVIPRMTTAHNFGARSLTVYRFLCTLAMQHGADAFWTWGALADFPFLPRIRRGKVILDRARWLLSRRDLAPLDAAFAGSNSAKTPAQVEAIRARAATVIAELRTRLQLPRWVVIGDADNELPVDLDNPLMVDSAAQLLKGRGGTTLYELSPAPDELVLRGPEGAFAHELITLFARAPEARRRDTVELSGKQADDASVARRFLPGSEWLYLKLYTGPATADVLLRDLAPTIERALADNLASHWFFIRYGDPDNHLRLRFAGDPSVLAGCLLPRLHATLADATARGLTWRIVVDTYEREVERYGGRHGIELAEQIFAADSDAVLAILSACEGDAGAEAMWRLAVRGCDQLMDDLGLTLEDKLVTMTRARDAFGAEHGIDTAFQKRLGDKFRKHGKELASLLAAPADADHPFAPALGAFAARSLRVRPLATELRARHLDQPIEALAHSYLHMHVNRMIRSSQRAHELVLYDLLRRHYDGQVARAKHRLKKTA